MPEPNPHVPSRCPLPPSGGGSYCYIDFDGFFAGAEQHLRPELRGHPVAVYAGMPGRPGGALISVSVEARAEGIKSGMRSREAKLQFPSLHVLAQRPVEYILLHHELVARLGEVAPIHHTHSVDEVSVKLSSYDRPDVLMAALREKVDTSFSTALSLSAGVASSVWLAKVAAESGKPRGTTDWTQPGVLPDVLFELDLEDLPGVAERTAARLRQYGLDSVRDFYDAQPSRVRAAYGSVVGERIWFAMHGYDVPLPRKRPRQLFVHARVLASDQRARAAPIARWLALCGWLRARDEGLRPGSVRIQGTDRGRIFEATCAITHPAGEKQLLGATSTAWTALREQCLPGQISVVLGKLVQDPKPHDDLLAGPSRDPDLDRAFAAIRERFGLSAVRYGETGDATGPWTGLKIAFDRVPTVAEVRRMMGPDFVRAS